MNLNFTKMQGLGNDFIVLDCTAVPINLTPQQIRFLADRKYGIGCDQVLMIEKSSNINDADFAYRIFNADGTEAEHCGNGARCVIQYLLSRNLYSPLHPVITNNSIRLKIKKYIIIGYKNQDNTITINMGIPHFEPEAIPFKHRLHVNNIYHLQIHDNIIECGVVSVGNPHIILKLGNASQLADTPHLTHLAQIIQTSAYFPYGVNVNFYLKLTHNHLKLRTYERGCGFTLACGTGATATASYAIQQQQVTHNVVVEMPGGNLGVQWDTIGDIMMTGPASHVFHGQIELCN